jgi:multicomponent Na+:H+ antiporter subunit G
MILDTVLDIATAILLLLGAFFSLAAGIGIVRFPNTLTRVHAGTKPQVLGLACILVAVILATRNWPAIAIMMLILIFQMLTTPAAAQMVGRAAYRHERPNDTELYVDELAQAVESAHGPEDPPAQRNVPPSDA